MQFSEDLCIYVERLNGSHNHAMDCCQIIYDIIALRSDGVKSRKSFFMKTDIDADYAVLQRSIWLWKTIIKMRCLKCQLSVLFKKYLSATRQTIYVW